MPPRKRVTASGEIVDEEIPEEPLPSGLPPISEPPPPPPPPPPEPKDYSYANIGGVFICKACENTKHTDPVARKELCSVADPSCPRSQ